ncbi:MAG: DUF4126 domain-containing protein [Deltaproteobacteria bacterium]|nr:DUF4126 domain-containing protein [Deltaproteobacteria bacterium]
MVGLETVVAFLPSLALAIALAASAGLRAWLPLLAASLLARFNIIELGESFGFMASTPAIVIFSVATLLEICADKVPALDHGLDVISTVVRPLAATLLAGSVMFQIQDPLWALALGLIVGAPTALVPHAAKSGARVVSSTTTAGIANPFISLLEDLGALVIIIAGVLIPIVTAVVVVLGGVLALRWWRRRSARPSAPPAG